MMYEWAVEALEELVVAASVSGLGAILLTWTLVRERGWR
jgi:hypothetical protein